MISKILNTTSFGSSEVAVRINSVDTDKLAQDDMNMFLQGLTIPSTFLVPKVEHVRHLNWVCMIENDTLPLGRSGLQKFDSIYLFRSMIKFSKWLSH